MQILTHFAGQEWIRKSRPLRSELKLFFNFMGLEIQQRECVIVLQRS